MSYVVTVETRLPVGADELDALRQVGASALLERGFDTVAAIEGPEGTEVDVLETIVAVHPGGAILKVFVHAPSLEIAEDAVGSVAEDVLEHSELLADWVVESSEVKLHIDLTRERLEAADGPDVPSSDLQARRAQHTAGADTPGSTAESGGHEGPVDHEARIRALAPRLTSFALSSFGGVDPEEREGDGAIPAPFAAPGLSAVPGLSAAGAAAGGAADAGGAAGAVGGGGAIAAEAAELAAGALVYASELLIDELYDDVQTLAEEETNVAECGDELWHLGDLPPRYALRYDVLFARRFLTTAIALTTRFTDGSFQRLGCLAEELVLKHLLEEAHATLELYGLLDSGAAEALACFAGGVHEDMDVVWLYDPEDGVDEAPGPDGTGTTPPAFDTWFTPFDADRYVHPYAADEEAGPADRP
ncbi:hypothetical protein [Streptomyces sp. NPDC002057]|uniref:hypothetical protein n=1 Tax=Streptomyces sp. NPDC002057 TaxID=3154664 RepID=UPI0033208333